MILFLSSKIILQRNIAFDFTMKMFKMCIKYIFLYFIEQKIRTYGHALEVILLHWKWYLLLHWKWYCYAGTDIVTLEVIMYLGGWERNTIITYFSILYWLVIVIRVLNYVFVTTYCQYLKSLKSNCHWKWIAFIYFKTLTLLLIMEHNTTNSRYKIIQFC